MPRFTLAPMYLAEELGFFRETGLEVDFHPSSGSVEMIPLLASGQVQVSMSSPTPAFINAALKGARVKIVAARDIAAPACQGGGAIFGSRKAFPNGLRDLRSLKGKRVAIASQAGIPALLLDEMLEFGGLTTRDVTVLTMRAPEAAAALSAGKIDAVSAVDLEKDLDYLLPNIIRSATLSELLPNYQYSFVIFGATLLEGDPEIGTAFLSAYLRGVQEYRAGKTPRALEELARAAHHDPAAARTACRESISRDGRPDRASIQRFVNWAVRKGFIPRAVDASELIDTRFVEEANRRLERRTIP
jgi:NitT/TauT family transport system substrate-binding protein